MKVAVFDTHSFERPLFAELNARFGFDITFFETRLTEETLGLAKDFSIICSFTNDRLNAAVLARLEQEGVVLIALRSAPRGSITSTWRPRRIWVSRSFAFLNILRSPSRNTQPL